MTAATVVCCNMTSLSQTRYGSAVRPGSERQGRWRRWRSYQASKARAGKMAEDGTYRDMTKVSRPVHGPRSIASVVPVVTRKAFSHVAPGVGQLVDAWTGIVGPALAVTTSPRRLAQGTLTIGCCGPMATELQHLSSELISRINQYLGRSTIRRLRFVQTVPAIPSPGRRPRIPAAAAEAAANAVAGLPDGPLRAALAALGRVVLAEAPSRLGTQPNTRR